MSVLLVVCGRLSNLRFLLSTATLGTFVSYSAVFYALQAMGRENYTLWGSFSQTASSFVSAGILLFLVLRSMGQRTATERSLLLALVVLAVTLLFLCFLEAGYRWF